MDLDNEEIEATKNLQIMNEELKTIIKAYDSLEGNTENKIIVFDKTSAMINGELFINRYISKDKIKEILEKYLIENRKKFCNLGCYVRDNATSEQERIAGAINVLNKIKEELLED